MPLNASPAALLTEPEPPPRSLDESSASPLKDGADDETHAPVVSRDPSTAHVGQRPPQLLVVFMFVLYAVSMSVDRVFMKRMTNSMGNPTYNLVLWNIVWPVTTQFFNLAYMLPYVWLMRKAGHEGYTRRFLLPGNPTASSGGAISVVLLGTLSLGDQMCTCLCSAPCAFISQTMLNVMGNMGLVFQASLSALWLGTRYRQGHYASFLLIVMSVMVNFSDKFSDNDCSPAGLEKGKCLGAYKGADKKYHILSGADTFRWYGLNLLAMLPFALGSVYKQYILQGRDVEVVYATWWAGVFQVPWGMLCFTLSWTKMFGDTVPPGQTFQALRDTGACILGYVPHPGDESCAEDSPPPWFWYILYLAGNVMWVVLRLWLTKYLSAVWTQTGQVLCFNLTSIFGMFPVLAGGGAQNLTVNDAFALVLASIALWVYGMEPEIQGPRGGAGEEKENKAMDSPSTVEMGQVMGDDVNEKDQR
mmetsp:Transcript_67990/g.208357  ORF Transcript_67990/g.208357 Transcript_67990/m.208357 type:complete len:474 (-) Transcript_67990:189-1610(-)